MGILFASPLAQIARRGGVRYEMGQQQQVSYREHPVEDPVLGDGQEAVHGPGQVVLVLEVAQLVGDDLGGVRAAAYVDEAPLPAEAVVRRARVVAEVRFAHVPQDEHVLVAVALHVAVVGRVQEHGVLVPLDLGARLGVHVARDLGLDAVAGADPRRVHLDLGRVY